MQQKEINIRVDIPYLKNGGEGFPSEVDGGLQSLGKRKHGHLEAAPVVVVGDGGVSWRLKALKRAKEQAEREGRRLDHVVEERWGSLTDMIVSVSSKRAAHHHAHVHAIRDRKRTDSSQSLGGEDKKHLATTDRSRDIRRMVAPNASDSLSWRRQPAMCAEDREILHDAALALNRFQNDGSFLQMFNGIQRHKLSLPKRAADDDDDEPQRERSIVTSNVDSASTVSCLSTEGTSANHLAAKALQLRLQGDTKEADALLVSNCFYKQSLKSTGGDYNRENNSGDAGLAESIVRNKQYNRLPCVDDECESSVGGNFRESRMSKKGKQSAPPKDVLGNEGAKQAIQAAHKRIITQEERCQFCFNNPSRPKHLTISIANSCYLMLPPWEPLVDGHCLLLPTQHEGGSRNVDESVWEELRNYKKCLLQMFAKQGKGVLFIETVINLAQQRRHCLIECIPLPPDVAKQAPLYFKKAIDDAEDEWSQHDAKKLIDTRGKGLRACIPKHFPYFHVEFGLHAGFVHVIDNERGFKSDFGRNVVIGMLNLPEEEMHRRRKQQSYEQQKKAAVEFQKAWDPFDWTKMLD